MSNWNLCQLLSSFDNSSHDFNFVNNKIVRLCGQIARSALLMIAHASHAGSQNQKEATASLSLQIVETAVLTPTAVETAVVNPTGFIQEKW